MGLGNPGGGQDYVVGATRVEQRDKGSVHEQPGDKVDRSYHSKEGSSKYNKGNKGSMGSKGNKGSREPVCI